MGAGGEGDDRGWDGWMASPTWWTWVWVNSGSWWWTGRPGMLWFMGSQRVGHDWATELNWWEGSGRFREGSLQFSQTTPLFQFIKHVAPRGSSRIFPGLLCFPVTKAAPTGKREGLHLITSCSPTSLRPNRPVFLDQLLSATLRICVSLCRKFLWNFGKLQNLGKGLWFQAIRT